MRTVKDVTPTFMVDTETEEGKTYVDNVSKMLVELNMVPKVNIGKKGQDTDKFKSVKKLNENETKKYSFLQSFLDKFKNDDKNKELFKMLKLNSITVGRFNRKAGYVFHPMKEGGFRFIIHLGDNEVYYLNSMEGTKMLPMMSGSGFILSPALSTGVSCTVYSDPIRILNDARYQQFISKIRMKNYQRTTLVFDYDLNIPDDYVSPSEASQTPEASNHENVESQTLESQSVESPNSENKTSEPQNVDSQTSEPQNL